MSKIAAFSVYDQTKHRAKVHIASLRGTCGPSLDPNHSFKGVPFNIKQEGAELLEKSQISVRQVLKTDLSA